MPAPQMEITITCPDDANLDDLVRSTESALKLLAPWCKTVYSSPTLNSIVYKAQSYVEAINFSTEAAQHGFNIADDAVNLAQLMPTSSPQERHEYLLGMWRLAEQGRMKAGEAMDRFTDVRKTVFALILAAQEEQNTLNLDFTGIGSATAKEVPPLNACSAVSTVALRNLKDLKDGIGILETFGKCVSIYISWWNCMYMNQGSQSARAEQIVFNYASLREVAVINRWHQLKQAYCSYVSEVLRLRDTYPEKFFAPNFTVESGQRLHKALQERNIQSHLEIPKPSMLQMRQSSSGSSSDDSQNSIIDHTDIEQAPQSQTGNYTASQSGKKVLSPQDRSPYPSDVNRFVSEPSLVPPTPSETSLGDRGDETTAPKTRARFAQSSPNLYSTIPDTSQMLRQIVKPIAVAPDTLSAPKSPKVVHPDTKKPTSHWGDKLIARPSNSPEQTPLAAGPVLPVSPAYSNPLPTKLVSLGQQRSSSIHQPSSGRSSPQDHNEHISDFPHTSLDFLSFPSQNVSLHGSGVNDNHLEALVVRQTSRTSSLKRRDRRGSSDVYNPATTLLSSISNASNTVGSVSNMSTPQPVTSSNQGDQQMVTDDQRDSATNLAKSNPSRSNPSDSPVDLALSSRSAERLPTRTGATMSRRSEERLSQAPRALEPSAPENPTADPSEKRTSLLLPGSPSISSTPAKEPSCCGCVIM
ncbi:hypothetical protein B0H34DRAFT_67038 [Crassisporium funariophilum]|nr:hypothetical protein B0H34DRAFT_67038 [Crassisporium funariophilum]